ncbi:MAG: sulfur carrier protein ThiS [Oscillospiraceae bacterium]|nr:sulfur carrier protein ThiS [Oscillospiraceae bacterium]
MTVNGKPVEYQPITLLEYLRREGYEPSHVVIERNMEIITRERFGEVVLGAGDEINILRFMGGG